MSGHKNKLKQLLTKISLIKENTIVTIVNGDVMKKLTKKYLITGMCCLSFVQYVSAQDFVEVTANAGADAITEAAITPYIEQGAAIEEYLSAEDKLADFADNRGWQMGWDPVKKRIFVIHSESFDNENPAYDKDFITKRSMFTSIASLSAKAKIVEFMREEMTAIDQLESPGTDVYAELNEQFEAVQSELLAHQATVIKLANSMELDEAASLEGATWNDRSKELLVSVIKKIDDGFDSGAIESKKRKKFDKTKERFNEATTRLQQIKQKAASIAGKVTGGASSVVRTLAKAPVMGATLIAQAESWNEEEEQYEVAVLMVWSSKLEKSASGLLAGEIVKVKPKAGVTIRSWIKKQDLATLTGSRQVVDEQGQRWFVGAYAMPYTGSSSAKRKSKAIAEQMAKKEAVMSLYADVETYKQATIALKTRSGELGGKDNTQIATSMAESTRQAVENRQVSGNSKIAGKVVVHPISGTKIYVAAYAISPQSAIQGLAMEAENYKGAIKANQNNLRQRNLKAVYEDNDKQAKEKLIHVSTDYQQTKVNEQKARSPSALKTKGLATGKTVINADDIDDDDF
ncbi:MAG: hypothetical protein ACJAXJ_000140 [Colwellia sp.]